MNRTSRKIFFIVNPNSGMGVTGKEWPRIRDFARDKLGPFRSLITTAQGDATRLAREALKDGADLIICVGGDGTFNEILNGFMEKDTPIRPGSTLAFIPRGTGCDLRKSLQIPREPERVIRRIRDFRVQSIDLGRIRYMNHGGGYSSRYFHNVISFGLGGEVVERVNNSSKALGGFISFIRSTLVTIFTFDKKTIRLKVDNGFDHYISGWHFAVANGQFQGGGMRIAPEASIDDGLFHVTVIGNLSLREVLINLYRLYNGTILEVKKVSSLTGKKVEAWSDQRVLLDMDGEQPGLLPATVDIIPKALPIIVSAS